MNRPSLSDFYGITGASGQDQGAGIREGGTATSGGDLEYVRWIREASAVREN